MNDINFLHNTFDEGVVGEFNQASAEESDRLEQFAVQPMVLIVEDDIALGQSIKMYLEKTLNCCPYLFYDAQSCLNFLSDQKNLSPFCLVTDIALEKGSDGLWLIDYLKEKKYKFTSIVMTGFGSIETAILATKKGVLHYLTKPFDLQELRGLLLDAIFKQLGLENPEIEKEKLRQKMDASKVVYTESDEVYNLDKATEEDVFCKMIGRSQSMKDLFTKIKKVALTDSTVLITGPSGTGKELVANSIKSLSNRANQEFVSVNCGAIPGELLESELFGHVQGAFTGAVADRKGRFEKANKGTIFLDEIGDMPLLLQVKLLRVLQNKTIELVGSSDQKKIDTRVIAATHRDLEKQVADGNFREDLYYRLNVIPLRIPSLKDRKEDIPLLINHFVGKFTSANKSNRIRFCKNTMDLILKYDWPGNVRELENLIERLVILKGGNTIKAEDLPPKIIRFNPIDSDAINHVFELPVEGIDLKKLLTDIEYSLIDQAMKKTGGNKNQASRLLSLNRTTLIEKMKKRASFQKEIH